MLFYDRKERKVQGFTCNSKDDKISLSHESNKKDKKSKTKEKQDEQLGDSHKNREIRPKR